MLLTARPLQVMVELAAEILILGRSSRRWSGLVTSAQESTEQTPLRHQGV
jgi:hypothetical protein